MPTFGPHARGTPATVLRARRAEVSPAKNQGEIARKAGFVNPNVVSMVRGGHSRPALDRVASRASALDADPARPFSLALQQAGHETVAGEVAEIFGVAATRNEAGWLEVLGETSDH